MKPIPVAVTAGIPQASAFTLAHSNGTPGGVLITRYVRSGEVRAGSFEGVD